MNFSFRVSSHGTRDKQQTSGTCAGWLVGHNEIGAHAEEIARRPSGDEPFNYVITL